MVDSKKRRKAEDAARKVIDSGDLDSERKVDQLGLDGENKKAPEYPPVSFFQTFRFVTRFEVYLNLFGLAFAIANGAAMPLMSLLVGKVSNDFIDFRNARLNVDSGKPGAADLLPQATSDFKHNAARSALWITTLGLGSYICAHIYMYIWTYTGESTAKRTREQYLRAILRQDIAYFDNVGSGEVASRIQNDTHLLQQGISEKVALCAMLISSFFTGFAIAYGRSWRLALALSSMLPCIVITGVLMAKFISKYTELSLQGVADGSTIAEEVISSIRTAHAFGTQKILGSLYKSKVDKTQEFNLKAALAHAASFAVFFFVLYGGYGLAFSFGTTLVLSGHADGGTVVTVFYAILIGSFSLSLLPPEIQAVVTGRGSAAKLFATIDRVPSIDSADPAGLKPEKVEGVVSLHDVSFNYPSRPTMPVLRNLSITFAAGKTSALVGASGSGKSTIIALTERFYDPLSGSVKFDGVDVKDLNVKWLRSQIGLVSQEPVLFATSIKDNIAQGLIGTAYEHSPEEKKFMLIKEAAIKVNADGFISGLPNGYDTRVGERGFLLSGGQKQRVAIARAIVSNPRILLLDEATSALDTRSEVVVQDALDKASAGRTTITIAHRLSTVKDADTIYVMGDGQVLESGTHQELLRQRGPYYNLVESQKLREAKESEQAVESKKSQEPDPHFTRQTTRQSLVLEKGQGEANAQDNEERGLLYVLFRLAPFIRDKWLYYLLGAFFACCSGAVYPAFAIVFARAMEDFSSSDRHYLRTRGDRNALWFFIIAIIATVTSLLQNYAFASAASTLTIRLRSMTFNAILRQDVEFFDKEDNSTGALTARLSTDPQKVDGLVGITLGVIVQSIATVIIGAILGIAFLWKLGLVATACVPFILSAGYIQLRVVVLKDKPNKKAHADSAQLACEAAGAIRTVASLTREDECLRIYSNSLEEPLRNSNRLSFWATGLYALSQAAIFFTISLTFWYGSKLVADGEATLFEFFTVFMSTVFGAMQTGNDFIYVPDMSSAGRAGGDILQLLDSIPEIDAGSKDGSIIVPATVQGHIHFENVCFRYPTRPGAPVLRGLSFEVRPGTYNALVGDSGSGKSTAIQLLERFYDPLEGDIYLDGQRISDINVQSYRQSLALVSQEPTLYAGSIRFNILIGAVKPHSDVTEAELEEACRKANILDFIRTLPQGFDTEVGGKGSQLSVGQKQRIAIARALLRNPTVLLLDEATSALDSNSEKVVQDALDSAAKGRTTIAIAHRLSTIQNADCIFFVKNGTISESGTHEQLIAKHGDYYEYVQLQALSANQ